MLTARQPLKTPSTLRLWLNVQAASLVECTISTAVIALFLSGAFALNSHGLALIRSSTYATVAEQCSRDRLEKMRNASWERMVDADYIRDVVLASTGNTFPNLRGLKVTIDVMPYPLPSGITGADPIFVTRNTSGTVSIIEAGSEELINERTVLVKVTTQWTNSQRARQREAYTLVSKGGISGRNK